MSDLPNRIETPQDREDRITQRVLSIGSMLLCSAIVLLLLFRNIPTRNEVLIGTVVGFIFGNMIGPVFRSAFGGPDSGTRQNAAAQSEVLKSAVNAATAAASSAVVVERPARVDVVPGDQQEPLP